MSYIKTKGVILKEVNAGEADKILTILTKSHGKITGYAKSSRRPRSRLIAGTQLFCYSDMVLFKGKDMYSVNSCDVIEPFYSIRNDIVKLTYAVHMCDILIDTVQEEQPSGKTLQLFLNSLYMLANSEKSPALISHIFELRLLKILGYAPRVSSCVYCGSEDINNMEFDFTECGLVCSDCARKRNGSLYIRPGTVKALQHIIYSNINDLFKFDVSEEIIHELDRILKIYLRDRLEKDYNKTDFLKTLNIK